MEGPAPDRREHILLRARDWQHRPQLDMVCEWWRSYGAGLCALVGIGGAGKTAIADRFLQLLPGVLPENPRVPKRTDFSARATGGCRLPGGAL